MNAEAVRDRIAGTKAVKAAVRAAGPARKQLEELDAKLEELQAQATALDGQIEAATEAGDTKADVRGLARQRKAVAQEIEDLGLERAPLARLVETKGQEVQAARSAEAKLIVDELLEEARQHGQAIEEALRKVQNEFGEIRRIEGDISAPGGIAGIAQGLELVVRSEAGLTAIGRDLEARVGSWLAHFNDRRNS